MTYAGKRDREALGAKPLPVSRLLGQERLHAIPLFQRPYVWTKDDQWEPFWRDVEGIADSILDRHPRAHFLGAVVFKMETFATGEMEVREVVDGQQRLSTVLILIKALRDVCAARDRQDDVADLDALLFNSPERCVHADDRYKLLPNNVDRAPFLEVMNASGPASLASADRKPITDAYRFFSEKLEAWLSGGDGALLGQRVSALKTAIRDRVRIVVIDLDANDDPQTIFESLNARGTPLLASDLVKNYLFRRAKEEGADLERLYGAHWKALDEDPGYWRLDVGRGHAKRPRIELFLQHFTSARLGDEVLADGLFRRFREWAEGPNGQGADQQLRDFRRWADQFRLLDERRGEDEEGQFFERLRLIDIATVFPLLLTVYEQCRQRPAALAAIRRDLESLLVRRMVCVLSTRGYGRLFLQVLTEVTKSSAPAEETIRQFLLAQTSETGRWPDDAEFERAWREKALGNTLRRDRVEMMLKAIERCGRSNRSEALDLGRRLTVEHVLPEDWETKWPLPADQQTEEHQLRRDTLVQTMGNLTLVTGRLNSSMGNSPWEKKKAALTEYSGLWLNAELIKKDAWGEKGIEGRSTELVAVARSLWPRPAGAAPLSASIEGAPDESALEDVDADDDAPEDGNGAAD